MTGPEEDGTRRGSGRIPSMRRFPSFRISASPIRLLFQFHRIVTEEETPAPLKFHLILD